MKKERMNNKGFSLVELIIVIAIMAVLVVVLAPQFLKYVERARVSTDKDNAAAIATAFQVWAAAEGNPATAASINVTDKGINDGAAYTSGDWAGDALTDAGLAAGDAKIQSKRASWGGTTKKYTVTISDKGRVTFTPADIGNPDYNPDTATGG